MKTIVAALLLGLFSVRGESPFLTQTLPVAVAPGRATRVQLTGSNLAGPAKLWTSCDAATTQLEGEPVSFNVTVPSGTPLGIGALRVLTTNGASTVSLFLIDPLPAATNHPGNNSFASAQTVTLPIGVDAYSRKLEAAYYKFSARKGQRLSVEAVAQRLGSLLDPRVRLLDAEGRELLVVDDSPGCGADNAFTYAIPSNGDYVVEIRDTKYEGGPGYYYRLRLGEFSLTPLPFLSDAISTQLLDAALPSTTRTVEREPNDTPQNAQAFSIPTLLSGSFAKLRDRDWYEFHLRESERLRFTGRTRSIGSACDLFLQIQDAKGKGIAEANVTGADEGTITNTFKKAGAYRLLVEELNRQGGPNFNYQIEVTEFRPGFTLSAELETASGPPGGTFEIPVKVARRGFEGPIKLTLVGLDARFTITNDFITGKTNETKLQVIVPPDIEPGAFWSFVIVGQAELDSQPLESRASTAAAMRKLFPEMPFPPDALDGLIGFGVSAPAR